MGQLNIYKIDNRKQAELYSELMGKYKLIGGEVKFEKKDKNRDVVFYLSFYIDTSDSINNVEWDWLVHLFGEADTTIRSNPKGILLIISDSEIYACTYGFSFFVVDKFCDTDFAFDFARRIKYVEIKTTTLFSPTQRKNKVVNTYLDYRELEFDSGESYAKLKLKADLPDEFKLFTPAIEIGHSIKFEIKNDSIRSIIDVLLYISNTVKKKKVINKIPVFRKVSSIEETKELEDRLRIAIENDPLRVNLSELDIIGVSEIFLRSNSSYMLKYYRKELTLAGLEAKRIKEFFKECDLSVYDGLTSVKIISMFDGVSYRTDKLHDLIDYIDDDKRYVLLKGRWYYFNDDYMHYLADSIAEIDAIYEDVFDFNQELYDCFLLDKYNEECKKPKYKDKDIDYIKNAIREEYYREYAFNLSVCKSHGYVLFDRKVTSIGNMTMEIMDLYGNETVYSVKFGGSSSKLCYAIDQLIGTMKQYKHNSLGDLPETKKFGIWLHLKRRTKLRIVNGKPNVNELRMLLLKIKLDEWKKEVRLLGYSPIIRINYF